VPVWQRANPLGPPEHSVNSGVVGDVQIGRYQLSRGIKGISCPSAQVCVALRYGIGGAFNDNGIDVSTNPAGGTSAWSEVVNDGAGTAFDAVSCPSISLCVVVDQDGSFLASTRLTSERSWNGFDIDRHNELTGISCPALNLCVAVDFFGNVITTHRPTSRQWQVSRRVDGYNPLTGVSCASSSWCVAVDAVGNVLTSTDPAGGAHAWRITRGVDHGFTSVSCPSATLCVAVDEDGYAVLGTPTT
jgi:hypothetical protein